jgi:hypothetical protein
MALKPGFLSVCFSLGIGLALLFWGRTLVPESDGAYLVLSLDQSFSDRDIAGRLREGGIVSSISESGQWVFLDDFGNLERVPLDEYPDRVEEADPRNDGYAEALRNFFVGGGKRRFFIPLDSFTASPRRLMRRLDRLFPDIPFTAEGLGKKRPLPWFFLLFVPAAVSALLLSRRPLSAFFLFPLTAFFVFFGPAGFAQGGICVLLFLALGDPLRGFFASRRYGRRIPGGIRIFRGPLILSAGLLAGYVLLCFAGALPAAAGIAGIAAFGGLFFLSLWEESRQGRPREHRRFLPLPIRVPSPVRILESPAALPFALAALVSLALSVFFSGHEIPGDYAPVDRSAYERHLAFQRSFSRSSLWDMPEGAGGGISPDYLHYTLGEDGLIGGASAYPETVSALEAPPFPLEDLMDFLGGRGTSPAYFPGDILSVLILLGFCLPLVRRAGSRRKKKGILIYNDKRIAA